MQDEAKSRGTILVVEDDPSILDLLACIFQSDNYDVVPVDDGETALELTRRTKADLITLDLCLPGMDGQEVLNCLKNDENTRQIPVIVISAHVESLPRCTRALAAKVITKPFDIGDLLNSVDRALHEAIPA